MTERSIALRERSGVLHPENLTRYRARWISPGASVTRVVDSYWCVEWNVGTERIAQRIVAAPAITLSLEQGAVPAPRVITGVHARAWQREITGSGRVFGIRLRPAGLAVLSELTPGAVADRTMPVTEALDARLHALMASLPLIADPEVQAAEADARITESLARHPIQPLHLLANEVVDRLVRSGPTSVATLAAELGVGARSLQRALAATIGKGPSWVGRCVRLQDVVRLLSAPDAPSTSAVAATLGYVDQAHLVNDFRRAVGITPGAYLRSLRTLRG